MIVTYAIDPGIANYYLAAFGDDRLAVVGRFPYPEPGSSAPLAADKLVDVLVVEDQVILPNGKHRNLLALKERAESLRWIYAAARQQVKVKPNDWKGSTPKPISHRRIWRELSPGERVCFARAYGVRVDAIGAKIHDACARLARTGKVTKYSWDANNWLDAVGIGLWYLRRLTP